jgi:hypothetical protein
MSDSKKSYWEPSYSDIEWTKTLIGSLKNGGTWVVPANGAMWTFWHDSQKANLRGGSFLEETNKRIRLILTEYLGWEVS